MGDKEKQPTDADLADAVSITRFFRYARALDYVLMTLGMLSAVALGALAPVSLIPFALVIDTLGSAELAGTRDSADEQVMDALWLFIYMGVAAFGTGFIGTYCFKWTGERQAAAYRKEYLRAIMRQDVAWHDERSTASLAASFAEATQLVEAGIGTKISEGLRSIGQAIAGAGVGLYFQWDVGLVMLALSPLTAGAAYLLVRVNSETQQRSATAFAAAGSACSEALTAIRTVASFSGESRASAKFDSQLEPAERQGIKGSVLRGFSFGMLDGTGNAALGVGMLYAGALIAAERSSGDSDCAYTNTCYYSPGRTMLSVFAVLTGATGFGLIGQSITAFTKARAAAGRMQGTLQRVPAIDILASSGKQPAAARGLVEFKAVRFTYPARPEAPVYTDFSLTVEAGKTVALVGGSGSGKSTAIQLLERFYDVSAGSISLDGVDIRELNLQWLRQQIGLVGQEPALFEGSIMHNIAYGRPDATEEEIVDAARMANAHEFISALPDGYKTRAGAGQISGGQKQRIAIARAIVKRPTVLLLDEATSALDNESERIVQDALDKLVAEQQRTTIVIAHRLTTVRGADKIAVVGNGRVLEEGTHTQLMKIRNGQYANLVAMSEASRGSSGGIARSMTAAAVGTMRGLDSGSQARADSRAAQSAATIQPATDDQRGSAPEDKAARKAREAEEATAAKAKKAEESAKAKANTRRIWSLQASERGYLVLAVVTSVSLGALVPLLGWMMAVVLFTFFEPEPADVIVQARFWSLLLIAVCVLEVILHTLRTYGLGVAGERLTRRLRALSFANMLRQDMGWFDDPSNTAANLSANLARDVTLVAGVTAESSGIMIANIATLVVGTVLIFWLGSWQLGLASMGAVPLMGAALSLEYMLITGEGGSLEEDKEDVAGMPADDAQSSAQNKAREEKAKSAKKQGTGGEAKAHKERAATIVSQLAQSVRTVASFGLEDALLAEYSEATDRAAAEGKTKGAISGLATALSQAVFFFVLTALYALGAYLVSIGETDSDSMFIVIFVMFMMAAGFGQFATGATDQAKAARAVTRILSVLDRPSQIDPLDERGARPDSARGLVEFKAVRFTYPTRPEAPVYTDFSLTVEAGKTVALVGGSGSGKSTAIQLLERFYDVSAGSISLDGVDIRELNLQWLRQQIGLVGQEPVLFDESVALNIAYGRPDATREEIVDAARMANAHEFISAFPDGYDTRVGQGGGQLSGGQKQRIAIARAIVKRPALMLLDEATSALDNESERIVQAALDKLLARHQSTTIVIAHRLSTVRGADKIAVVGNGRVLEEGTHTQLMFANGAYARMHNAHSFASSS